MWFMEAHNIYLKCIVYLQDLCLQQCFQLMKFATWFRVMPSNLRSPEKLSISISKKSEQRFHFGGVDALFRLSLCQTQLGVQPINRMLNKKMLRKKWAYHAVWTRQTCEQSGLMHAHWTLTLMGTIFIMLYESLSRREVGSEVFWRSVLAQRNPSKVHNRSKISSNKLHGNSTGIN